jgi:hypothetical protein
MCRNFTYEVVGRRRKLKAIKKICSSKNKCYFIKINIILFFDIEFFKYFFRVLHEASSSWLKFVHSFQKHPVYCLVEIENCLSYEKRLKCIRSSSQVNFFLQLHEGCKRTLIPLYICYRSL